MGAPFLLLFGAGSEAVAVPALTFVPAFGPRITITLPEATRMRPLHLGTDDLVHIRGARVFDPTTGTRILATGLSLTAHVALAPTGPAVDASLSVELTERVPGEYHGTLLGTNLEAHLREYLGELVCVVFTIPGGVYLGHYWRRVVDGVALGA